jgi:hypothetical protein
MKQYNKKLGADITELKILHARKDKTEFKKKKAEIMQRYGISKATVYREMKKDTPGMYKRPSYNPPSRSVTETEIMMVKELLVSGRQNTEIIKIMTRELGFPYNWDRFNKVRKLAEETQYPPGPIETVFARGGKWFLINLFNLEYMAPGSIAKISVNGHEVKISRETFDMLMLRLQIDNAPDNEDRRIRELREEVYMHHVKKETIIRTSQMMRKGEIALSGNGIHKTFEAYDKLKKSDIEKKEELKFLLQKHCVKGTDFYKEEDLNDPSEFRLPDEKEDIDKHLVEHKEKYMAKKLAERTGK